MPLENAVEHVVNCSLKVIGQICMERGVGVHGGRLWSTGHVFLYDSVYTYRVRMCMSVFITRGAPQEGGAPPSPT